MELIFTSIFAFVTTNIDDIFIVVLFFADSRYKRNEIIFGQLIGIAALITVSLLGSLIGLLIKPQYIGLLGLVSVYLGIKKLFKLFTPNKEPDITIPPIRTNSKNILSVATVTFANGGDNIGIYIPLFVTLSYLEKITMTAIFFIMTILWCALAQHLTKHSLLKNSINKCSHIIIPFVLILLGIYILFESGAIKLFTHENFICQSSQFNHL